MSTKRKQQGTYAVVNETEKTANVMRVAIAGTGGLASRLARTLYRETSHQLIWLSRTNQPSIIAEGYQVVVVDYQDPKSLEYAFRGVDVVLSTVPQREAQIRMIEAAVRAGVQRFAVSGYEGRAATATSDAEDQATAAFMAQIQLYRASIELTVFVCGILYERFAPGGLVTSSIGFRRRYAGEGQFMVDVRNMRAEVPYSNVLGQEVAFNITAAQDVARFVVRSLGLPHWPPELVMRGERLTCYELLQTVARVRGLSFQEQDVVYHSAETLQLALATEPHSDTDRWHQLRELLRTQEGRYDYSQPNLNASFPNIAPQKFESWLSKLWSRR